MAVDVSVVIPVYNNVDTVVQAVRSALEQVPAPAEVLVVDDGSTDGSRAAVAAAFGADPRIKVIGQPNGGPSRARNRGIEAASSPLIAFLDADDLWLPDKLRLQIEILRADATVGLVASDWMREPPGRWDGAADDGPPRTTRFSYRDCLVLNRFQTSTVLMRTELARALGGFDPSVDGAEDWDFWVRAAQRAGVVKIDRPLVVYRDVATGYSKDVWRVYRTMHGLLDKHRATAPRGFRTIEAWHHLRFFVALRLMGDRRHARAALGAALQPRLRWHVPAATLTYLLPFLYRRRVRRAI
jgi:glycosyltransferase involved in cell wall biosynthesis